MKKTNTIQSGLQFGLATLLLLGAAANSNAASVTLTTSDGYGGSSFNVAGGWNIAAAPSAANDYFTGAYTLRTPTSGSITFLGGSLTVNSGGAITMKGSSGAVMTVTNLILAGGLLNNGNDNTTYGVAGGINVTGNSALGLGGNNTRAINISSTITGSATLTNGYTGNGVGTASYTGNNTGFTGPMVAVFGAVIKAGSQTNIGGNPASFNAGQLTLDNGVLQPTASFALNNANSGVTIGAGGAMFNITSGLTLTNANPLAGTGPITNGGAGKLLLNGSGTGFTGNTVISAGTVVIGASGSLPNTPAITIASGATLDVSAAGYTMAANQKLIAGGTVTGALTNSSTSQISPGGSSTVGNLTVGNLTLVDGGQLIYDFNATTNDVIYVNGNLSPSGVTIINLFTAPPGGFSNGTNVLINVTGTLSGSAANFSVLGLQTRKQYHVIYDTVSTPNRVLLVVSGTPSTSVVWQGDVLNNVSNVWDLNTSSNWLNVGVSDVYFDSDTVNFTDIGSTNQPTLNITVNPAAVVFNSTNNYSLTGTGSIAGSTSLTQAGSGTTTLSTTNTYTGGTVITNGVLKLGNGAALGKPSASLATISGTGTLDLAGYNTDIAANTGFSTNAVKISGSGTSAHPSALFSKGGYMNIGWSDIGVNNLVLNGDATIGSGSADFQIGKTGLGITGNNHILTKIGNEAVYLWQPAVNALSNLVVAGGYVLFINNGNALGSSATIVLTNGGYIDTWNPANWTGLTFGNPIVVNDVTNGGAIHCNQGAYYAAVDHDTYNGNITLNGPLTIYSANTLVGTGGNGLASGLTSYGKVTVNGVISGTNGITIQGGTGTANYLPGGVNGQQGGNIVVFNGNNTYSGLTLITNLIQLQTTTANQSGGAYDVVDYGTLDVALASGKPTMPMSSLTLEIQTMGEGNLSFAHLSAMPTSPVIYATNLNITYGMIVPPAAGYTVGQFPLIKYETINANGFGNLYLKALPRGVNASLVNNTDNNSIDLLVTTAGMVWSGTNSSAWDIATTQNWLNPQSLAADYYYDGDALVFDDTTTNFVVSIPATVQPGGLAVNTTNTYFFGGTAGIGGTASLAKTGSGTLIVSNANTFTGGTFINGGTLKLANNAALNNTSGQVTVSGNGTLDFNYQQPTALACTISGAGFNGLGTLVANYTNAATTYGPASITLAGSATIGGTNRWDMRNGANTLNSPSTAYTLTKVGSSLVALVGTTVSANLGDINIFGGQLGYQLGATGLGNPTNTIRLSGGGLEFYQASVPLNKNIVCSNGASFVVDSGSGSQNTIVGPVSIVTGASVTFNATSGTLTFTNPISITNGTINCSGNPLFAGGITNLNGTVTMTGSSIMGGPVNIPSGSTLQFNGNYYNTLTFSNVISGSGTLGIQYQSYVNLAASNTFSGNITVPNCNAGSGTRLKLIGNGSITKVPLITLQGIATGQASAGYMDVSGRVDGTLTLASGQTLRGDNGSSVIGNVVASSGSTLTPGGAGNIQYTTVSSNLTLQAGSTTAIDIGATNSDQIIVGKALTFGGTLTISTNGTLTTTNTYTVFSAGSYSGSFSATNLPTLPPTLKWDLSGLSTGVVKIVTGIVKNPIGQISVTTGAGGTNLSLEVPTSAGQQYILLSATNLTSPVIWSPVNTNTGTGGTLTNTIQIDPTSPEKFFRYQTP